MMLVDEDELDADVVLRRLTEPLSPNNDEEDRYVSAKRCVSFRFDHRAIREMSFLLFITLR
jgi:hypothetical protein